MNLHTPERGADETQAQYRQRQRASKAAARELTHGVKLPPAIDRFDFSRFWLGQHTNEARSQRRVFIARCGGIRQAKRVIRLGKRNSAQRGY